jgi:hypothetical protein
MKNIFKKIFIFFILVISFNFSITNAFTIDQVDKIYFKFTLKLEKKYNHNVSRELVYLKKLD